MGARSRQMILLLALCALVYSDPVNIMKKEITDNELYQYEDDYPADENVLFNEDKPCPRDCICTVHQGYKVANCNRLEVGTQKFGDDITDLVIENADPKYPIELDDFIFKKLGLQRMSTVKIINSTIGSVGPKAFHGLDELYALNLSGNKLRYLHQETFATNKKLLLLTISNNSLKFPAVDSEEHEYFLNASTVQELVMSNCNMQYITSNTFKYMPALMYINVAGNNINVIDPNAFKKLLDLEELDLSDNNIKSLPADIFSDNNELATLHIQKNPIETVYDLQISDLLTLNAGQTNIRVVGPSMFNGMPYIANLNLSGNSIEKIHNLAFHKLVELSYLDLSYNNLNFISNILIKNNNELEIFKISNNPNIKFLPEKGFNCSVDQFSIYRFDASNCGLEVIYDYSLSTFTALSQINLSQNKIKSISPLVFSSCPKLIEINLAYNELTTLNNNMFANNKELGKLNLQGNPLKMLSIKLFTLTPALMWLDISHTDLTTLWKEDKEIPITLLNNLNHLNMSYNRINEVKVQEIKTFNKLRSLDISNNPLVCGHEFENLMGWLNNRTITPSTNSINIANLARDPKEDVNIYKWDSLIKKTCGILTTSSPSISDEEIWERIDKDAEGNFDLKDTLDDAKVADDVILTINNARQNNFGEDKNIDADNIDDIEDDKDDIEGDNDDDDEDDDDDIDDEEDLDDNDYNMSVKTDIIEKPKVSKTNEQETPFIKIELIDDNLYNNLDHESVLPSSVMESIHGHYDYIWPIVIAILVSILLLIVIAKVVMAICQTNRKARYNSAIIAAMSQSKHTKKDCGLIYQPLSEDLTEPATPKLHRYQPLPNVTVQATNMSYESSTFHHKNIVPEAV